MLTKLIIWLAHATSPLNRFRRLNFVVIFILFLLPVIVAAAFSYSKIYDELTTRAFTRRQAIALPVVIALQEKLDGLVGLGNSFALHPKIREAAIRAKWDETVEILGLFQLLIKEPFVDRVFIADAEGTLRADNPHLPDVIGKNFSSRDWYQGVLRTGKPYVSEVYKRAAEPQYNIVAVAIPVVGDENLLKSIIVLQVRLDHFLGWLKKVDVGEDGFAYVVDQRGKIVTHPRVDPQLEIADFSGVPAVQKVMQGQYGVEVQYNPLEKNEELVAYEPVPKYGWGVVVQQSAAAAFAARYDTLKTIALVYVLIFLFDMFLVYLILQAIAHYQDHHDIETSLDLK